MMGSALCVPLPDAGHGMRLAGTSLYDDASSLDLQATVQHLELQLALPEGIHFHQHGPVPFAGFFRT
jgi:hypothetical protein